MKSIELYQCIICDKYKECFEQLEKEMKEYVEKKYGFYDKRDGMLYKKIAEIMQISESAVESLLHRGRANLRKNLAKYFEKKL